MISTDAFGERGGNMEDIALEYVVVASVCLLLSMPVWKGRATFAAIAACLISASVLLFYSPQCACVGMEFHAFVFGVSFFAYASIFGAIYCVIRLLRRICAIASS